MRFRDLRFKQGDGTPLSSGWMWSQPMHDPGTGKERIVSYRDAKPDAFEVDDLDENGMAETRGRIKGLDRLEVAALIAGWTEVTEPVTP